jgi:hypothetical protein
LLLVAGFGCVGHFEDWLGFALGVDVDRVEEGGEDVFEYGWGFVVDGLADGGAVFL